LGDIACFSFNGNKIITTGGGGMIVTDRQDWAERAKYLTTQAKDDAVEFVHNEIGYNYRLTNIQAAMGCAQLEVLDEYIAIKRQIAERYTEVFQEISGITPLQEAPWAFSVFWMYAVEVDEERFGIGSRALLRHLEAQNIQTRPLWQPLHLSPAYERISYRACSVATQLYENTLSLPCSVGLKEPDQERVIDVICVASKPFVL
jgi:perosamine synthetase